MIKKSKLIDFKLKKYTEKLMINVTKNEVNKSYKKTLNFEFIKTSLTLILLQSIQPFTFLLRKNLFQLLY